MKLPQNKWLRWAALLGFYLFALLVFLRLTFPYETLRQRLVTEINQSQKTRRVEIDELSGHWLWGVEAEGVRLYSLPKPTPGSSASAEDAPSGDPLVLQLDSLTVSLSLLSYVFGSTVVHFQAEVEEGRVSGRYKQTEALSELSVKSKELDISSIGFLADAVGLPLSGSLSGQMELSLPERKLQKAEGQLDFQITDLMVGDGKAKVRNTIALPQLAAGQLQLKADVTAGRLDVSEFTSQGTDFEMNATGRLRLRDPFDRSMAELEITFRFKEAYTSKSEITQSIFGSPDGRVPGLFDMDPQVRQAKKEDGSYRWRVTGSLSRMQFRPSTKTDPVPTPP